MLIICRSVCFCSRLVWSFEKSHHNAILEAGEQGFYAKTSIKDLKVKAHILHEAGEIAGNMEVASVFCSKNPGVKSITLLPNVTKENEELRKNFYPKGLYPRGANKNADAIIGWSGGEKWLADFKCMGGNGGKLLKRLEEAYNQGDFAIIKIKESIKDPDNIKKVAESFMKQRYRFKGIIIYDNRDREIFRLLHK